VGEYALMAWANTLGNPFAGLSGWINLLQHGVFLTENGDLASSINDQSVETYPYLHRSCEEEYDKCVTHWFSFMPKTTKINQRETSPCSSATNSGGDPGAWQSLPVNLVRSEHGCCEQRGKIERTFN
jgi:hypothetical protein